MDQPSSSRPTSTEPAGTRAVSQAWGFGLATLTHDGRYLDTWFPEPRLGHTDTSAAAPTELVALAQVSAPHAKMNDLRGVHQEIVEVQIDDLDDPPANLPDAYLRLHLLSHRLVQPNTINLTGIFAVLANVVWTDLGPCQVDGFEVTRARLAAAGHRPTVKGIDKFPQMLDYVIPTGVRIADPSRVRLGAHLAEGTTVMHEGFVNFNAGTLGTSMIEGRVSQGVVIEDGTDVGGGASIMGMLSGGGRELVRIGKRCLLGANSGIAIPLGDDCVVEAGTYITAGAKIRMSGGEIVKAVELSGVPGLLFWRNSLTGSLEAKPRAKTDFELNEALHANT